MQQIAAIVVTYNRKEMLYTCISKLLQQESCACDILVIDNGSTDGTEAYIRSKISHPSVIYHNTGKNLGGAGGFSAGIQLAFQMGYSYIWLMDDDTYVERDSLEELLKADQRLNGNYGFLSSIAYWKDGKICNMNRQHTSLSGRLDDFSSPQVPVKMASFVSFWIKREIIECVGLPISEFFIWSDDLEYSRRISRQYPCYAVPSSKVMHNMNSNSKVGIEQDSLDRLWRYAYLYRNEVYVYRREGLTGWLYLWARVLLHSYRVLTNGTNKSKKLRVIWRSFFSGFHFHPPIKYVQM